MPARAKAEPAVCENKACGQRADRRPGFRLYDAGPEAIFVGEEAIPAPQWLECIACGTKRIVPGGSIEVRRP
jgi:hypothetical protein